MRKMNLITKISFSSLFIALGRKLPIVMVAGAIVGSVIVICGNYLPKCKQNYSIGIRLPWTLNDEENWNLSSAIQVRNQRLGARVRGHRREPDHPIFFKSRRALKPTALDPVFSKGPSLFVCPQAGK